MQAKRKNLYTAGTGFAHILVMLAFLTVVVLPMGIMQALKIKITTSIQSFMMESVCYITFGLVSPSIIFWASSEARNPAKELLNNFKQFCRRIQSNFKAE